MSAYLPDVRKYIHGIDGLHGAAIGFFGGFLVSSLFYNRSYFMKKQILKKHHTPLLIYRSIPLQDGLFIELGVNQSYQYFRIVNDKDELIVGLNKFLSSFMSDTIIIYKFENNYELQFIKILSDITVRVYYNNNVLHENIFTDPLVFKKIQLNSSDFDRLTDFLSR